MIKGLAHSDLERIVSQEFPERAQHALRKISSCELRIRLILLILDWRGRMLDFLNQGENNKIDWLVGNVDNCLLPIFSRGRRDPDFHRAQSVWSNVLSFTVAQQRRAIAA